MVDFSKLISEKIEKLVIKEIKISGIRTDSFTGKETLVELKAFLTDGQYGKVFKIEDGPTGYESFYLDENNVKAHRQDRHPWIACMGAKRQWDRLVIPNEEIIKAFDFLEVT